MDGEKKICPECKTENEPDYRFCKNCGTPLTLQRGNYAGFEGAHNFGTQYSHNTPLPEETDGIKSEKLVSFVGKNGDTVVRKWASAEAFGRKSTWCWPVFILTLFWGLAGAAFWFLYRRMYKAGALLLALGIVFSAAFTALTFDDTKAFAEQYMQIIEKAYETGDVSVLENALSSPSLSKNAAALTAASRILQFFNAVFGFILGLFSLGYYKKFAKERILQFETTVPENQLSLLGGTSGGALALGIVLYIMARIVLSIITVIVFFKL